VSSAQSVGVYHNDVLLSVSFPSRIKFRVAIGIIEASGTLVVYKAFYRLVWRANIFGLAKEREECSTCLRGSGSSHGKQFTLSPCSFLQCSVTLSLDNAVEHNIILSKINSRTGYATPREENSGMKTWERKVQAWLFERLRETQEFPASEQTLEDKQVVQNSSAREASAPH